MTLREEMEKVVDEKYGALPRHFIVPEISREKCYPSEEVAEAAADAAGLAEFSTEEPTFGNCPACGFKANPIEFFREIVVPLVEKNPSLLDD